MGNACDSSFDVATGYSVKKKRRLLQEQFPEILDQVLLDSIKNISCLCLQRTLKYTSENKSLIDVLSVDGFHHKTPKSGPTSPYCTNYGGIEDMNKRKKHVITCQSADDILLKSTENCYSNEDIKNIQNSVFSKIFDSDVSHFIEKICLCSGSITSLFGKRKTGVSSGSINKCKKQINSNFCPSKDKENKHKWKIEELSYLLYGKFEKHNAGIWIQIEHSLNGAVFQLFGGFSISQLCHTLKQNSVIFKDDTSAVNFKHVDDIFHQCGKPILCGARELYNIAYNDIYTKPNVHQLYILFTICFGYIFHVSVLQRGLVSRIPSNHNEDELQMSATEKTSHRTNEETNISSITPVELDCKLKDVSRNCRDSIIRGALAEGLQKSILNEAVDETLNINAVDDCVGDNTGRDPILLGDIMVTDSHTEGESDKPFKKPFSLHSKHVVVEKVCITACPATNSSQNGTTQQNGHPTVHSIIERYAANKPPSKSEKMSLEFFRLESMHKVPDSILISLIRLAQAGFYSDGNGDELVCFACGVKKSGWRIDDNPIEVHRELSPDCQFLADNSLNVPIQLGTNNVSQHFMPQTSTLGQRSDRNVADGPSSSERESGYRTGSQNTNIGSQSGYAIRSQSFSASGDSGYGTNNQNTGGSSDHNLVISDQERQQAVTKFPQYSTFEKRLSTYEHWPSHLRQQPRDLASCGFFYTGIQDGVRCHRCAVGLRNWDPDDNPWVEHARWSRKCSYILEIKGQEFVNMVLEAARQAEAEQEVQREREEIVQDGLRPAASVTVPDAALPTRTPSTANQTDSKSVMPSSAAVGSSSANSTDRAQSKNTKKKNTKTDPQTQLKEVDSGTSNHNQSAISLSAKVKSSSEGASKLDNRTCSENRNEIDATERESRNKVPPNTDNADTETLKKQIKEMNDLTNCKICLDKKVSVVFLPCGHLVACAHCSPALRKCPICRQFIKGHVRTTIGN